MNELAYTTAFPDGHTHARKSGKQANVVKHGIAKAGSSFSVVLGDVAKDFGEIVQRLFRVEEAVVHLGTSSRAFSAGSTRPASASRMPSSTAARVSSSSSSKMGAGASRSNFLAFAMTLILGRIAGQLQRNSVLPNDHGVDGLSAACGRIPT
ncbi:hypothetical protein SBA7_1650010 [Candidatus Sulfotelmatobacter sp. SbA7]|nr:hypothetical protein SBA7_1650010 [Candidatus Sulfotelmatobacter sp. SbA7]